MMDTGPDRDTIRCARCGGQRVFNARLSLLICGSCGAHEDLTDPFRDAAARREHPFDPTQDDDTPSAEPHIADAVTLRACTGCGGQVVFTGHAMSEACPYCNGAMVNGPEDAAYAAMGLIPFAIEEEVATILALEWIAARYAAPSDLSARAAEGRLAGLYAPFWTFDSDEALDYWARYNVRSNKRTYVKTLRGRMSVQFDDLLVPASPHVTPLIRDGILHDFRPEALRAFRPGYLAGFAAERHHQTVAEGLHANADDKALLIRNRIQRAHFGKELYDIGYRTDTTGIHYRRILLPVWILHYTHRDTPYRVVVSGIDGRTFGERPFSALKLAGYAAAISGAVIAFGLWWGAVGLL